MPSFRSYSTDTKPAVLIIGPPGSGKSCIAAAFPKPYIVECDNNIDGVIDHFARENLPIDDIWFDVPHINPDGTLVPPANRYIEMGKRINAHLKDHPETETIVIDSLTTLNNYIMDEVRRVTLIHDDKAPDMADPPTKDGSGFFWQNLKDRTFDETWRVQDWGSFVNLLIKFFTTLRSTGRNVVVTAHTEEDQTKDAQAGRTDASWRKFIACPGKFKSQIAGYFTDAWYTEVGNRVIKDKDGKEVRKFFRTITTVPITELKELGLKTALNLPTKFEVDLKEIASLIKRKPKSTPCPTIPPNQTSQSISSEARLDLSPNLSSKP